MKRFIAVQILTVGMTSAGFRRFFVRRQNSMNTTKIKIIITNDTDATMILNTGLVSENMSINIWSNIKNIRFLSDSQPQFTVTIK